MGIWGTTHTGIRLRAWFCFIINLVKCTVQSNIYQQMLWFIIAKSRKKWRFHRNALKSNIVGGRTDWTGSYLLLCFLLLSIILPYSHIPNLILSSLLQLGQFRHQDPKIKSKMISGNDKCEPPDSIKSLVNSDQHPRFNRNIRN